jgi:hypothetical protein
MLVLYVRVLHDFQIKQGHFLKQDLQVVIMVLGCIFFEVRMEFFNTTWKTYESIYTIKYLRLSYSHFDSLNSGIRTYHYSLH